MAKTSEKVTKAYTRKDWVEHRREVCRKSQQKRREEAKHKGYCQQCCKRPTLPNRTLCEICIEKSRSTQYRYSLRKGLLQPKISEDEK